MEIQVEYNKRNSGPASGKQTRNGHYDYNEKMDLRTVAVRNIFEYFDDPGIVGKGSEH